MNEQTQIWPPSELRTDILINDRKTKIRYENAMCYYTVTENNNTLSGHCEDLHPHSIPLLPHEG